MGEEEEEEESAGESWWQIGKSVLTQVRGTSTARFWPQNDETHTQQVTPEVGDTGTTEDRDENGQTCSAAVAPGNSSHRRTSQGASRPSAQALSRLFIIRPRRDCRGGRQRGASEKGDPAVSTGVRSEGARASQCKHPNLTPSTKAVLQEF